MESFKITCEQALAWFLYSIFPGLLSQCISVMHPRRKPAWTMWPETHRLFVIMRPRTRQSKLFTGHFKKYHNIILKLASLRVLWYCSKLPINLEIMRVRGYTQVSCQSGGLACRLHTRQERWILHTGHLFPSLIFGIWTLIIFTRNDTLSWRYSFKRNLASHN